MNPGDLTTLANVKQWLGLTGLPIAAISRANPAVLTLATRPQTPLLTGQQYQIEGITGMVELTAGPYAVTVIDPLNFSIPVDSTTFTAYTGGGIVGITDPLLQRLISSCSTFIQKSVLNQPIASTTYTETRNGTGGAVLPMRNTPITGVTSLVVDGVTLTPRPAIGTTNPYVFTFSGVNSGYGYVFTDSAIMLGGGCGGIFPMGIQNVQAVYTAGYLQPNEAQTIPASAPYTLETVARWSAGDRGVTFADGTALVAVTGAPAQGEYSVDDSVYTFNAADAGLGVLISYAVVPYDVEQAAIDTIGDWFIYTSRIGKTSQSIEGQSTSFTNTALPVRARDALRQYIQVVPVGP